MDFLLECFGKDLDNENISKERLGQIMGYADCVLNGKMDEVTEDMKPQNEEEEEWVNNWLKGMKKFIRFMVQQAK